MLGSGRSLLDLSAYLAPERICFLGRELGKQVVLEQLAALAGQCPAVSDPAAFKAAIFDRERVSSTGIGGGIAVPHAKIPSVRGFTMTVGVCRDGIEFQAKDQRPVRIIVMIAATDRERDTYLKVLATVATTLKRPGVVEAVLAAEDAPTVIGALTSPAGV